MAKIRTIEPSGLYACATCVVDIEKGGISDAEGYLAFTGRVANFRELCSFCAAPGTHELAYEGGVK